MLGLDSVVTPEYSTGPTFVKEVNFGDTYWQRLARNIVY